MNTVRIPFVVLAIVLASAWAPLAAAPPAVALRPNVLLIVADDLGFSDLGAYGGEIRTPNLDRLAADGLRFTQFYNCAVCVTTRAALTTGLYPRQGKGGLLRDNMVTLGDVMRKAGYATSLIGKWHLGGTAPHFPIQAPAEDVARYRGKYRDGYDALRTRRFQRQIELGLIDPAVTKLSPVDRKTGTFRYDYEVTPWERLDAAARKREEERMEVYAAMVDRLDQGIGRVLAALEESGSANNTVVFFLSDNGGCASWPENEAEFVAHNRELPVGDARGYEFVGPGWGWAQNAPFRRHKTWTYEGGICTPMIVRWPDVVASGRITGTPGHLVDFMPTLVEMAGGEYPRSLGGRAIPPMEGRSLMPALRGKPAGPRQWPLSWELYGNRAVRDREWKLVWGASDKRWELYNLAADRSETVNLAGEHPARVVAMAADWAKWAEQTGAPAR